MNRLFINMQARSAVDPARSNVYRCAEDRDFRWLFLVCRADDEPVMTVDLTRGERIPEEIVEALHSPQVEKWAFDAQRNRIFLSRQLSMPAGSYLNPSSWRCLRVRAATVGLPPSLEICAGALGIEQQGEDKGGSLARFFCKPCSSARVNNGRVWNLPQHAPQKWARFKKCIAQSLETEVALWRKLQEYPLR